ncbi:NADH-quinone oxidoreductase subunit NuoE [Pantoea sp. Mhis]|uniref:NADH-quinone oxidoreductase subunit NuoE n=1 Tax=Pantoea sp. Mhis TaxID=2576759 RepID=UPI001358F0B0|nr:NADH-quinone oxidoreductase subunit NuoE [Pantoea sp. Mhis]MXP56094.1 NADH-quinone oxidoreductase subunit NuoE [Pantoea sp. Mhis]
MDVKKNITQSASVVFREKFRLNEIEYCFIENEKKHYEDTRAVSIEALKIVQKQRGWISDDAIDAIAEILNIPATDVEGVATFYSQIYRTPVGRNVIRYCDSIVCYINGYQDIQTILENNLKITSGQTTSDGCFTLLPISCLGLCDKGPAMMINEDTHVRLQSKSIMNLLERYK